MDAEAEPEVVEEAEVDAEPEVDEDTEFEEDTEPDFETEEPGMDAEAMRSSKEAEDDHLSVSMQNEDAITLEIDGDDLLETGKHVKLPDLEAEKDTAEPDASAETGPDDVTKVEETEGQKDDGSRAENMKKAEMGDKEKDSGKKAPCTTGATGQAKRFVFLCQFFDTSTKSSSL